MNLKILNEETSQYDYAHGDYPWATLEIAGLTSNEKREFNDLSSKLQFISSSKFFNGNTSISSNQQNYFDNLVSDIDKFAQKYNTNFNNVLYAMVQQSKNRMFWLDTDLDKLDQFISNSEFIKFNHPDVFNSTISFMQQNDYVSLQNLNKEIKDQLTALSTAKAKLEVELESTKSALEATEAKGASSEQIDLYKNRINELEEELKNTNDKFTKAVNENGIDKDQYEKDIAKYMERIKQLEGQSLLDYIKNSPFGKQVGQVVDYMGGPWVAGSISILASILISYGLYKAAKSLKAYMNKRKNNITAIQEADNSKSLQINLVNNKDNSPVKEELKDEQKYESRSDTNKNEYISKQIELIWKKFLDSNPEISKSLSKLDKPIENASTAGSLLISNGMYEEANRWKIFRRNELKKLNIKEEEE